MTAECPYCEQPIQAHVVIDMAERVSGEIDGRRIIIEDGEEDEGPYYCGHPLSGGGECSREVDGPDETCFQHE